MRVSCEEWGCVALAAVATWNRAGHGRDAISLNRLTPFVGRANSPEVFTSRYAFDISGSES